MHGAFAYERYGMFALGVKQICADVRQPARRFSSALLKPMSWGYVWAFIGIENDATPSQGTRYFALRSYAWPRL